MAMTQSKTITHPIAANLAAANIVLPTPPAPIAVYVGYVVADNFVYVSGQLPMQNGQVAFTGKVGREVNLETAQAAAKLCAINILAQLNAALNGDWSRLVRCVKLTGFVNGTDDFTDQPKVINGASNFIGDMLGQVGVHARAAVGVNSLPLGVPVEVEAVFQINS